MLLEFSQYLENYLWKYYTIGQVNQFLYILDKIKLLNSLWFLA